MKEFNKEGEDHRGPRHGAGNKTRQIHDTLQDAPGQVLGGGTRRRDRRDLDATHSKVSTPEPTTHLYEQNPLKS